MIGKARTLVLGWTLVTFCGVALFVGRLAAQDAAAPKPATIEMAPTTTKDGKIPQPTAGKKKAKDDDEVEELDETKIEVVKTPKSPGPGSKRKSLSLSRLIGHLHPALVHFPIAWLVLLVLFELYLVSARRSDLDNWGLALGVLTLLAFAAAVTTGLILGDGAKGRHLAAVVRHRNVELFALGALLVALGLRLARRRAFEGALRWVYLAILFAATGLCLYGGHLGGKMVFGNNYLPF